MHLEIRPIRETDNEQLASVLRSVLKEFGFSAGSSVEDENLGRISEYYNEAKNQGAYFVISDGKGKIYGGGGFAKLRGVEPSESICELQKFYFLPEIRNLGYGRSLLSLVLQQAKKHAYKFIYLETASRLGSSIKLYEKFGFKPCQVLGNSGHQQVCDIFMSLALSKG